LSFTLAKLLVSNGCVDMIKEKRFRKRLARGF